MFPRRHCTALLSLLLLSFPLGALADPFYALSFLPISFQASGLNNSGQIVGSFERGAAVWSSQSDILLLGPLLPGSEGLAINDRGDIAGRYGASAFAWVDGSYTSITTDAPRSWATGINNAAQVAGTQAGYDRISSQQGIVYANGVTTVIAPDFTPEHQNRAYAINSAGVVAGTAITNAGDAWADPDREAFTYTDGAIRLYGTLGGHISEAEDINDSGMLAGWSTGLSGTDNLAFLYTEQDGMIDLGSLGGTVSRAHGLNKFGWVVGQSELADGSDYHAFLYQDGRMLDLNSLWSPLDGWTLVSADDINDAGQILAQACNSAWSECLAVRLDLAAPVPEPTGWMLLIAGITLLLARRRYFFRLAALLAVPILALPLAANASPQAAFTMTAVPTGFTASAINNTGEIVGTWREGMPDQAAAVWDGIGILSFGFLAPGSRGLAINNLGYIVGVWHDEAFIWTPGSVRDLGRIGYWGTSAAMALNDNGDVAGTGFWNFAEEWRGWRYSRGILNMIGSLGGDWSEVRAINKRGDVVGRAAIQAVRSPFGDAHAFVFRNRVLLDLGAFNDGIASRANDINDAGQVVGAAEYAYTLSGPELTHPFMHQNGVKHDLGTLGGASAEANGINNPGAVVGESLLADQVTRHAFLYDTTMRDLDALVQKPPGWIVVSAHDINDRRQMLATACLNEDCVAVRLDPITVTVRKPL